MLKRILNEIRFTLILEPIGPLLIKEGRLSSKEDKKDWKEDFICRGIINAGDKEKYPSAIFVSLNSQDELEEAIKKMDYSGLKFYIPGTSLRGVMRSHAEKIARTISPDKKDLICCNPFNATACSIKLNSAKEKKEISEKDSYKSSCVICKLFGNTHSASRIYVHDSQPVANGKKDLDTRDGIAIDRFTGGVSSGATFKNHFLMSKFENEITIRNFEIWQLGLLAYILRDFEKEAITVGSGKNKGFGRVKGTIKDVKLTYLCKPQGELNHLQGIGELCGSESNYGFIVTKSEIPIISDSSDMYYKYFKIPDHNGSIVDNQFWRGCAEVWNRAITNFKPISKLIEQQNKR